MVRIGQSDRRSKKRVGKFALEALENREMMAGDVAAYVSGKTLFISGDSLGNGVAVVAGSAGGVEVLGLLQDGSATTVNGEESETFQKVTNIVIDTKNGNDAVVVADLSLKGSLTINTGNDDDQVGLGIFDAADFEDSTVEGLLEVLTVKKVATVNTGSGDDEVLGGSATFKSSLLVQTGSGDDLVELVGDPLDALAPGAYGISVKSALTILTGSGDDEVILADLKAKAISVTTETGNDELGLLNVNAKTITGVMAPGEDLLEFGELTAKVATFVGEPGKGEYADLGDNSVKNLIVVGFRQAPV